MGPVPQLLTLRAFNPRSKLLKTFAKGTCLDGRIEFTIKQLGSSSEGVLLGLSNGPHIQIKKSWRFVAPVVAILRGAPGFDFVTEQIREDDERWNRETIQRWRAKGLPVYFADLSRYARAMQPAA
jgi:hypothetical protein